MNDTNQTQHGEVKPDFRQELKKLINKHSQEQYSNTPDFILVEYILMCLQVYGNTVNRRDEFYNIKK